MEDLKIKRIVLEVLAQLPPTYDEGYQDAILDYLKEVNLMINEYEKRIERIIK